MPALKKKQQPSTQQACKQLHIKKEIIEGKQNTVRQIKRKFGPSIRRHFGTICPLGFVSTTKVSIFIFVSSHKDK